MKLKVPAKVEVKDSEIHGLGVFATERIERDEIIEECHLITLPIDKNTPPDLLKNYRFNWPQGRPSDGPIHAIVELKLENGEVLKATLPEEGNVLPLGYGCIYNHNDDNNAHWLNHPRCKAFQFIAIKDIEAGEEICTNYGKGFFRFNSFEER